MNNVLLLNQQPSHPQRSVDLPSVDLDLFERGDAVTQAKIAAKFDSGMRQIGFAVITDHGVSSALLDEMMSVSRCFFELPVVLKNKVVSRVTQGQFCGWVPFAADAASRVYGAKTEDDALADLRERYRVVISDCQEVRDKVGPNQWPPELLELERVWTKYYRSLEELGMRVMRVAAAALQVPIDYFEPYFARHFSVLMATHSPAQPGERRPGQARCGVHTDTGTLTFVYQTEARGGLEVFANGEWLVPSPPRGSFVVNCGDLLARWTNHRWRSTVHRVGGPGNTIATARQSLVFFHQPGLDASLGCIPTCIESTAASPPAPITLREHFTEQQRRLATRDSS